MLQRLSHEQYDEKVMGLAATYSALSQIDFTPSGLTEGHIDDDVAYGSTVFDPLGSHFARGVHSALDKLRFDVGCWGRWTHESGTILDEVDSDKRLEVSGILAMMTAPKDPEHFDKVALQIFELLDNVVKGNQIVVTDLNAHGDYRVQKSDQHKGKIQVIFDNGHISSRRISIWSDRPDEISSDTPDSNGFHPQIAFPLLTVDLESLANGKTLLEYPAEQLATVGSGEPS